MIDCNKPKKKTDFESGATSLACNSIHKSSLCDFKQPKIWTHRVYNKVLNNLRAAEAKLLLCMIYFRCILRWKQPAFLCA